MTTPWTGPSADLDELLRELRQELDAARPLAKRSTQQPDPHVEQDNEDAFQSQWQRREQWLCDQLAHVLLELAQERSNLRLAANAGNSLLEQLDEAQDRVQALERELQARQSDLERVLSDEQRWREACMSMDQELRRMRNDLEGAQLNTKNNHCHRPQETHSQCTACQQHEREQMAQRQVIEELKRRCLSMEIEYERVVRSHAELRENAEQHDAELKQIQEEYDVATKERNALVVQLQELQANQTNVLTTRENIRRTSHRLKAETLALTSQLEEMQAHIDTLKQERRTSLTQTQQVEMQLAGVLAENQQLQDQQQQLQRQLREAQQSLQEFSTARQQAKDSEQLLDDATRQIEVLKADNRKLRWRMASHAALRRQAQMQTQNAGTTTCEAILAADRVHQNSSIENVTLVDSFESPDIGSAKTLGPSVWSVDPEVMPLPSRAEPKLRFAEPVVAVSTGQSSRSYRSHSVGMSLPLLAQMLQRGRRQSAPVAPASINFGSMFEEEKHLLDGGINEESANEDEENGDSETQLTIPFAGGRMQTPSNTVSSSRRDAQVPSETENQDVPRPQSLVSWLVISRMTRLQPATESGKWSPK